MIDWSRIDKVVIFTGSDENGNRYLGQFLKDYKETFQPDLINAGCSRCLEDYYLKFIKHLQAMGHKSSNDTGYVLKAKYEGIQLKFGSQTFVRNSTLTKEQAEYLLKNHKRGADLFDKIPDATNAASTAGEGEELSMKSSREELDAKALELGLNPEDYSNKKKVFAAITEAQALKEAAASTAGEGEETDATGEE